MYNQYYGFHEKPFKLVPDPNLFFNSEVHRRALSYLKYGVENGEGFIVISGDIGTGKSTLVNQLLSSIEPDSLQLIHLVSTNIDSTELLKLVARKLNIDSAVHGKAELLHIIEQELLASYEKGKRTLLIVDEAQNLPNDSIEELRMLSNFQIDGLPLVQSFLLGQSELRDHINGPQFEQFRQRIIASIILTPLTETETIDYVKYRIDTVSESPQDLITEEAIKAIFEFTQGVPRKINTLMDRVLLFGFIEDKEQITLDDVKVVIDEVESEQNETLNSKLSTGSDIIERLQTGDVDVSKMREDLEFIMENLAELKDAIEYTITFKLKLSKMLDKKLKNKIDAL